MEKLLNQIRVLDLTHMMAGPFATQLLADLGAEVLKIERPGKGDPTRSLPPYFHHDDSLYFLSLNRNKKSLTLDLSNPQGREIFYQLVEISDLVIENFRPGVVEQLQIDYSTLKEINQKIIYCSITGFGKNSPYGDTPAFDLSIQALGGGMSLTGKSDSSPMRMGIPIGDLGGGMMAAIGVLAALYSRTLTGQGNFIDISLLDSQVSLLTYQALNYLFSGNIPEPVGAGHSTIVPFQVFPTLDGYIAIMAPNDRFWVALCNCLALEHISNDPRFVNIDARLRNKDQLIPILKERLKTNSASEWLARLSQAGVPAAPVNTMEKVFEDPAVLSRKMIIETVRLGETIKLLGNPIKIGGSTENNFLSPPTLGEQTEEILTELIGLDTDSIQRLRTSGVI